MNAEQSNANQATNDSESNNNYPTDILVAQAVQSGATASGQETKSVSETSSAKQKCEESMKKFDVIFENKMGLEQSRFERRKLELEMQINELKTKHELLEKERELERKVKRTALENDDARPNQLVFEKNHPPTGPKRREKSQSWSAISTTF